MQPAGFRIATHCPGCGAAVDFGADFFVTQCSHCHSPLRLIVPHHSAAFYFKATVSEREQRFAIDRFCKLHDEPLLSALQRRSILFPYWNVDGILLKVRNEIERREVVSDIGDADIAEVVETPRQRITLTPFSTTIPAAVLDGIPASIGLRAKYITLYPLAADNLESEVTMISVDHAAEEAFDQAARVSQALSQSAIPAFGKNSNRLFPLSASLIFFPYAIYESVSGTNKRSFIVDLLSGEVTKGTAEGTDEQETTHTITPMFPDDYMVRLSFHRCPNCGNDLPQEQSFVYICSQCDERILIEADIPEGVNISFAHAQSDRDDIWLPFWVLSESETRVMPAFRSGNYEAMFRLSQRMTGARQKLQWDNRVKSGLALAPVQVPIAEAKAMFQASFARQSAEQTLKRDITTSVRQNVAAELLFVPFHKEQYFYIDSCLKAVTFEQAAVKMSGREPAVKSRV